ncbi:MAG: zinc ribbon domain-containing protein [Anaerolineaceae bacterium]|nr:zinc ribbon domain-containing protein [Anaerolineaceae bacterium]
MASVCPNCHQVIQMGTKFCGNCGAEISAENQVEAQPDLKFHQYRNFDFSYPRNNKPRQEIAPRDLNKLLRALEAGRGKGFENAKSELIEKRPVSAVDPLWRMANKAFVKDSTKEAAFKILEEIGSDHLVDLILNESVRFDDQKKVLAYNVIADSMPPRALEWLGKETGYESSPYDILAIELMRRIGGKDAIVQLVKNASGNFVEDTAPIVGKNLLLNMAIAGAVAAKQSINRNMAATLVTAPFFPLELLDSSPKLIQKGQSLYYRTMVVAELAKRHGDGELFQLYTPAFINSASKQERSSVEACIASAFLILGKPPAFMPTVINNVINMRRRMFFGDKVAAAVLTYAMMDYCIEKKTDVYMSAITAAMNDKDAIVSQSAVASALFLNYLPLVGTALKQITAKDPRFIPALAFCALFHDNSECKALLDHLETAGNKEVKYAIGNWREIISDWKVSGF